VQEESIQKTPKSSARRKFIGQFGVTGAALSRPEYWHRTIIRSERSQIEAAPALDRIGAQRLRKIATRCCSGGLQNRLRIAAPS